MVFRPGTLTGNSRWGEHTSLDQLQGGSGTSVSDPGQKPGERGHGYLDPWLVGHRNGGAIPLIQERSWVEKALGALEVSCARLAKNVSTTNLSKSGEIDDIWPNEEG